MDIQKLTKEQAVVISGFTGILCGEFSDFHTDVEKRLGRGVQTFEFGSKEFAAEVKKLYEADFIGMGTVDTEAAKAQAVPEGFVLVKMDDLELLRDSALEIKYASLNNDSDRIFSDIEDIQLSIERLIEAQEPAND
ncbi:DUF7736 domain-containing protein [Acinetobacter lwoffii]|uniref:DUF7736 domain-containing protein n=1 Tax=Acinetobacter lwoffii TaxID=28090 RepID=UPI002DBFD0EF|nr:hypothetical protein [Acinetobacter lwoffii]MEB6680416.1 hypothetical protein [Acinetobacter lwoffii]